MRRHGRYGERKVWRIVHSIEIEREGRGWPSVEEYIFCYPSKFFPLRRRFEHRRRFSYCFS